jgi:hypothetical protein
MNSSDFRDRIDKILASAIPVDLDRDVINNCLQALMHEQIREIVAAEKKYWERPRSPDEQKAIDIITQAAKLLDAPIGRSPVDQMWIVVSQSCPNCGSNIAAKLCHGKPTEQEINATKEALGGMFCIESIVKEVDPDEIFTLPD